MTKEVILAKLYALISYKSSLFLHNFCDAKLYIFFVLNKKKPKNTIYKHEIWFVSDYSVFLRSKKYKIMKYFKAIHIIGALLLVSFLSWYLIVGFDNVFACDDYWFSTNVRHYGFLKYQLHHWLTWEGSYTHTFLSTIPHVFNFTRLPFIVNLASLVVFFLSCFSIVNTFLEPNWKKSFYLASYLAVFLYLFTNGGSEIRFWMSVNFTYLLELSAVLLFLCVYHKSRGSSNNNYLLYEILFLFLIGGTKINFISIAYLSIIAHDLLYKYRFDKNTVICLLFLTFFVIINIIAPGNYIRLDDELSGSTSEEAMTLHSVILHRVTKLLPFVKNTLLLLPISASIIPAQLSSKKIAIAVSFFVAAFFIDSVIIYICFNDPGPNRVYISFEFLISIATILLLSKLYAIFAVRFKIVKLLPLFSMLFVFAFNILFLLQVPASLEYARQAKDRDRIVKNNVNIEANEIPKLPKSYLMPSNLANDEMWLKNIYIPYFRNDK